MLWLALPSAASAQADAGSWQPVAGPYGGSLAALALGQTIKLHFGMYNDGLVGWAAMYLDDVALLVARPPLLGPARWQYLPLILSDVENTLD